MTPNKTLKATRKERDLTQDDMADTLGISTARVNQFEKGESIPLGRIHDWCSNPRLPDWARHMAEQMWLSALEEQSAVINEQITQLSDLLQRDSFSDIDQRSLIVEPGLDSIPTPRKGLA